MIEGSSLIESGKNKIQLSLNQKQFDHREAKLSGLAKRLSEDENVFKHV